MRVLSQELVLLLLFFLLVAVGVVVLIGQAGVVLRARKAGIEQERWRVGEDAERLVAAELSLLARYGHYHVFNGLRDPAPGAKGDIDHLVIGPAGIFVVETKGHSTEVSADYSQEPPLLLSRGRPFTKGDDSRPVSFLRQLDRELGEVKRNVVHPFNEEHQQRAKGHHPKNGHPRSRRGRAAAAPWVHVEGYVCFTRARIVPDARGEYPPRILTPDALVSEITSLPVSLSDEDVDLLADIARRRYGRRPAGAAAR